MRSGDGHYLEFKSKKMSAPPFTTTRLGRYNREIATELLTGEGRIVETASDGVACIDMIEKADADYYKMILMDSAGTTVGFSSFLLLSTGPVLYIIQRLFFCS